MARAWGLSVPAVLDTTAADYAAMVDQLLEEIAKRPKG